MRPPQIPTVRVASPIIALVLVGCTGLALDGDSDSPGGGKADGGGREARCPAGFSPDPTGDCVDIDECARDVHACDDAAGCINEDGAYRCGACPGDTLDVHGNGTLCQRGACDAQPWRVALASGGAQDLAPGLGLPEPPTFDLHGYEQTDGVTKLFNRCPVLVGDLHVPVFLIDWEDYDPRIHSSDENEPDKPGVASYQPATRAALDAYLNGPEGVARYYRDASGGQVRIVFDVLEPLRSDTAGSHLRPRRDYVERQPGGYTLCDGNRVMRDVLADAVTLRGIDLRRYDHDANGVLDGAVVVYEGLPGLCTSGLLPANRQLFDTVAGHPAAGTIELPSIADMLRSSPTATPAQIAAVGGLRVHSFVNVPEYYRAPAGLVIAPRYVWAHELAHLWWYLPDLYREYHYVGAYALMGGAGIGRAKPTHPAALEKYIARWLEPAFAMESGYLTLSSDDIADGARYGAGPYLYIVPIAGDPAHFLVLENRWFDTAGNHATQWNGPGVMLENGISIVEVNLHQTIATQFSTDDSLFMIRLLQQRRFPANAAVEQRLHEAYRAGERFHRCWGTFCVTVDEITPPGARVSFHLELAAH